MAEHSIETQASVGALVGAGVHIKDVVARTGVPESTVYSWRLSLPAAYVAALETARTQRGELLAERMRGLIESAYDGLADRIEHGDEKLDSKSGTLVRVKMSGKDLAICAAVVIDKLSILRGDTPAAVQADRLEQLAEKLERMAALQSGSVVSSQ